MVSGCESGVTWDQSCSYCNNHLLPILHKTRRDKKERKKKPDEFDPWGGEGFWHQFCLDGMRHPHSGIICLWFRPSHLLWLYFSDSGLTWMVDRSRHGSLQVSRKGTGMKGKRYLPHDSILSIATDTLQYVIDKNERIRDVIFTNRKQLPINTTHFSLHKSTRRLPIIISLTGLPEPLNCTGVIYELL